MSLKKELLIFVGISTMFISLALHGHEGHLDITSGRFDGFQKLLQWIGNWHPILLQFPIALVTMTAIAEWLNYKQPQPIYEHSARFMLLGAALFVIPTALCGLALGYVADYSQPELEIYWWHRLFGLMTAGLVIATAYSKEYGKNQAVYYCCLSMAMLLISVTGYLGGKLTFG